jgi:predicted ATPase
MLLVLDNCEHVIEEARTAVTAILQDCPGLRILGTSREGLHVHGEQSYRMPSLSVPPSNTALTAEEVLSFGAPLLFADRALTVDSRFRLNDENAPFVVSAAAWTEFRWQPSSPRRA